MAGRKLSGADLPTSGPWCVRGEADEGASATQMMLGIEPATCDRAGGWPYLIRQDRPVPPGGFLHLATGIQRLADAKLMAAAPALAQALLGLLRSPDLCLDDLEPATLKARDGGWVLLVSVFPQLGVCDERQTNVSDASQGASR